MDEEKKEGTYETFRQVVDDYSEEKGHDLLTDPDAVAAARERVAEESAATHGERLRQAREAQGFTVAELAAKTDIDEQELAHVEAGEALLPLGQLIKLSKTLSLRMSDMISSGEKPFTIVRAGERQSIDRFGQAKQASHGYEYVSLAPGKKGRLMEPFIVTLLPAASGTQSCHDGQEFIYVLEGEMEVMLGQHTEILKPGDAVYYDSTSMHLVKAHGNSPAKILAVLVS